MPFNGSGTFISLSPPNFPALPFTTILASNFNANLNDIFTSGLTNCLTRDGQSSPTANLPMAGFRLTNLGVGTADTDSAQLGQTLSLRGLIGVVDWNTRVTVGIFEGTTTSLTSPSLNFPPTSDLGQLIVYPQGANIVQVYITGYVIFLRKKLSGGWSSWGLPSSKQLQSITATVASSALTFTLNPTFLEMRSPTVTNGVPNIREIVSIISLIIPNGATLGSSSGVPTRLILLALDSPASVELGVVNISGGVDLSEVNVINTVAMTTSSNSASTVYSTTARTAVSYRIMGFADIVQVTAGVWNLAPTLVLGSGGQSLSLSSQGFGQTWQSVVKSPSVTYTNNTSRPITVSIVTTPSNNIGATLTINGVVVSSYQINGTGACIGTLYGIVPPGISYIASTTSGSFLSWSELR